MHATMHNPVCYVWCLTNADMFTIQSLLKVTFLLYGLIGTSDIANSFNLPIDAYKTYFQDQFKFVHVYAAKNPSFCFFKEINYVIYFCGPV